jgi:hypothetical protein
MTGPAFAAWLAHMGWSSARAHRELGCGINTVLEWRRKGAPLYVDHACENLAEGRSPWSARFSHDTVKKPLDSNTEPCDTPNH